MVPKIRSHFRNLCPKIDHIGNMGHKQEVGRKMGHKVKFTQWLFQQPQNAVSTGVDVLNSLMDTNGFEWI